MVFFGKKPQILFKKCRLRGYHILQGDNSLKSVERFDHMMFVCRLEFVKILIFITVCIFKHTAKKIRKLNEQVKFYLKCMVPS